MLLYSVVGKSLMTNDLASKLGKYKHIILIAVGVAALGAYLLPLSTVFAAHNSANTAAGANQAARNAISNGQSSSASTNPSSSSSSGSGSASPNSNSNPNSNSGTSSSNPSSSASTTKPGTDTLFSNGNSAQVGGPGDNGNIGRGNTGTGNTGHNNNGNGNVGNGNHGNGNCGNNLNGNGIVGNNGNGQGGGKYGGPRGCGNGQGPQ
jgi:hypothetical protein